ncbi:DapH/DapD/GlmU-related protein [Chitinispirillales bacterium ANBcel5]|uniref:serine O-acetyltransferase EpsC n=1 Tax=Cellulosispirillum alkaliphilum TaxID=3039283 RepID=UPI002A596DB1|nr:DapH/DapD/GlmU-related protein [Chitinispirillales bacterium ANBcel5]
MNLTSWMNQKLPHIVDELEGSIEQSQDIKTIDGLNLAGREEIYAILDDILSVLFPGYYSKEKIEPSDMNFYLADMLRHISFRLGKHIRDLFTYRCRKDKCYECNCEQRAHESLVSLIESIPQIRTLLIKDINAAQAGDPAARFFDEIILSYPCIEAIATHRIAHLLYNLDVPIIPRIMSERAHSRTGIDIHPGAEIDESFFIDHGTGVVIGETCRIGKNVQIYQGVTLGAVSPFDKEGKPRKGQKRHPDIEDDVIIYANATILGGSTVIGKGAVVGGNTFITKSVEPGKKVSNRNVDSKKEHTAK